MALGQAPQALLTTLYRSTDRLSRRGAAVKNLAQSASLDAGEDSAPSKPGTKQLARHGVAAIWILHLAAARAYRDGHKAAAAGIIEIAEAAGQEWLRRGDVPALEAWSRRQG